MIADDLERALRQYHTQEKLSGLLHHFVEDMMQYHYLVKQHTGAEDFTNVVRENMYKTYKMNDSHIAGGIQTIYRTLAMRYGYELRK